MTFILEDTTKLLNRLNSLVEADVERKKRKEVKQPKVANTYGVAVNPQTGKMERVKKQGE
tara:strand:- start:11663 stop:11842 length:180 start_codon:yes stop_codon:yes gene_type:complete